MNEDSDTMDEKTELSFRHASFTFLNHDTFVKYKKTMYDLLQKYPQLKVTFSAFLLFPDEIRIYFGAQHLVLEYIGPNKCKEAEYTNDTTLYFFDYRNSQYLMDDILGFKYDGTTQIRVPLVDYMDGLFVPSSKAFDILRKNGWNFDAEDMLLVFNSSGLELLPDQHTRLVNCFFYGTDENGLIVRYIKWLDAFPLKRRDIDDQIEELGVSFWPLGAEVQGTLDAKYVFPELDDRNQMKLIILNRFVELISQSTTIETDITSFLSEPENQFILKAVFFAKEIHPEKECIWAEGTRKPIRPDFFVTTPDGYSDIVEFKLPTIKSSPIVGRENRETISAEINQYISQTRIYAEYFNDPRNRNYVKEKHGIMVHLPKRWLVIGRRVMFSSDEWRAIQNEFPNFGIRTYDDLIDGVLYQLYS